MASAAASSTNKLKSVKTLRTRNVMIRTLTKMKMTTPRRIVIDGIHTTWFFCSM